MEENPIDARIGSSSLHHGENSRQQLLCQGVKKIGSNPLAPALDQGCVELVSASAELRLNASALSSPNSLTFQLTSTLVLGITIPTLVDSSSTHCFLDSVFTSIHKLHTLPIPPIPLWLFDGTSNSIITFMVELPFSFGRNPLRHILRNSVGCQLLGGPGTQLAHLL